METLLPFKRGDTFLLYAQYTGAVLQPEFKCQIRNQSNTLIATPVITLEAEVGKIKLLVEDTTDWPISNLKMDIERTVSGIVTSSETIVIPVKEDVTRDE